jgi:hypothetical protein
MGAVVFAGPGTGPLPEGEEPAKAVEVVKEVAPAVPKRQSRAEIAAKVKGEG